MTTESNSTASQNRVTARVRQGAFSALVAAAIMLYMSFSGGGFVLSDDAGWFGIGEKLFIYTIRYGGFVMLAVALAAMTGRLAVLLIDAVASTLIGAGVSIGSNPEAIRAMTYNIQLAGSDANVDPFIDTRRHQVFETVTTNVPDLIGFQEASSRVSNTEGLTQRDALQELFVGTQYEFYLWPPTTFSLQPLLWEMER